MDPLSEEETPEKSGCAGGAVLVAASLGTGVAVYAYSRDVLVIVVWILGAVLLWRAARKKVPGTPDPAPPPVPERGSEEEPQVTLVRDTAHPNRWLVTRESPWMTEEIDKEAGTT